MATPEDRWHSLATALMAGDTSQLCRAGAPADPGRWCKDPSQSGSVGDAGPSSWHPCPAPGLEFPLVEGLRPSRAWQEKTLAVRNRRPGQQRLQSPWEQPQQELHISAVTSQPSDVPVLGRDPLLPAVSINEFKHFPAQQLEPLLVLHLCLINEIASNLNISGGLCLS